MTSLAALALALIWASVGAASAHAYQFTPQQLDDIREHMYDGSPHRPTTNAYLRAKERLAWNPSNLARSRQLHTELRALRTATAVIPRFLGPLGLAVTAGTLIWQFGSGSNAKHVEIRQPPAPDDVDWSPTPRSAGELISSGSVGNFYAPEWGWSVSGLSLAARTTHIQAHSNGNTCNLVYGGGAEYTGPLPEGAIKLFGDVGPRACYTFPGGSSDQAIGETWQVFFPGRNLLGGVVEDGTAPGGAGYTTSAGTSPNSTAVRNTVEDELTGPDAEEKYPTLGPWYQHQFGEQEGDPDAPPDPLYTPLDPIPNCAGLSYNACVTALQDAGYGVYHRNTRSFEQAVPLPQAQPDQVFGTTPAAGGSPSTLTDIAIDTNPADEDLPRLVPDPAPRETPAEYEARALAPLGLELGTPEVLPDGQIDPTRGPDEVVSTDPAPGSRVEPGSEVVPRVNPSTAPEPLPDAWTQPPVRSPDLTPLAAIPTPCTVFPFGIFCWLHDALGGWSADAACPQIEMPFGASVDTDAELLFDGCTFNPAMDVIRPIVGLVSMFGIVFMFAASALGIGTGKEDD